MTPRPAITTAVSSTTWPSVNPLEPTRMTSKYGFIQRLKAFWVTPGNAFEASRKRWIEAMRGSSGLVT